MKRLLIIFLAITSCKSFKTNQKNDLIIKSAYIVYKIDSINNFYLIYAKDKKQRYKIISKKIAIYNCNKIKLDSSYSFNLKLLSVVSKPTGNEKIIPVNYMDMERCVQIDNETEIYTEPSIEVYSSKSIKGLCFVGHNGGTLSN
ncbi:MAG: hypothetical protein GXO84_05780 [Chlorobi bacterium]|nr:hypothetical protein [Chlorobiota bacterium]